MDAEDRFRLIGGPYAAPLVEYGDRVLCEYLDREVVVGGMSAGPIPWPTSRRTGAYPIILFGDLVRAVQTESAIAVAHWWGVSPHTVSKWRKAVGVGRFTRGTKRLYEDYYQEKRPDEYSDHSAAGKLGGATRGQQVHEQGAHPRTAEALRQAAKRPKSEEWKRRTSERARQQVPKGSYIDPRQKPWTAEEEAVLGTDFDRAVAARLGRSVAAVRQRRAALGIPAHQKNSKN